MKANIRQWFEERWPLSSLVRWFLHEKINGGARFAYVFGSSAFFLFLLQIVTGVWQMFYYVPTVDHAYDSVSYLRTQVPFGWLIHGLHYWGANAFIVVLGCHAIRVFIWGAYKRPRELTWLLGVVLLVLAASFIFTGAILPWDNMGYWAGEVGTSIAGTVPWVGDFLKLLIRGGPTMDQLALSRLFVSHVAILPGLGAMIILAHLVAFRRFGSSGPWESSKRQEIGWFWPTQVLKDTIVICSVTVLLVVLTAYAPAPISGPADPLDSSYTPKPEWNFLFLYQGLKAFKGAWEPVGTVGIPLLIFLLLAGLPFLDRREERSPRKRPVVMACGFLFAGGILALTVWGYYSTPGLPQEAMAPAGAAAPSSAPRPPSPPGATSLAGTPAGPFTAPASSLPREVQDGRAIFLANGCGACHAVSGKANLLGPDLQNEANAGRSVSWLKTQIRAPRSNYPDSIMPAYPSLAPGQLDDLVAYLMSLSAAGQAGGTSLPGIASAPAPPLPLTPATQAGEAAQLPSPGGQGPPGPAARMIGNPDLGGHLYGQFCLYCHGKSGAGQVPNPGSVAAAVPPLRDIDGDLFSKAPLDFAQNLDRYIQHGSKTPGSVPAMDMPAFGSTHVLTQQQIANIEAYVLQLNGVDRAEIIHPGVTPPRFAFITVVLFATIGLALGVAWLVGRRRNGGRDSPARHID